MKAKTQASKNAVAGAFVASFVHTCNRFMAGKKATNQLETKMFQRLRRLSPEAQELMKRTTQSFGSLSAKRKGPFATSLMKSGNKATDTGILGKAFAKELTGIVSGLALGPKELLEPGLEERPGKVRLYEYGNGDDVYPHQVHIFKVNDIRTNDYLPRLRKNDYKPGEWQTICTPRTDGDEIEWDCRVKQAPCDGHSIDNVCLRVLQVQSGTSVTLTGVNFFDINAKVWMRRKGSTGGYKKINAFVYGDISTPVKKTVNGKRVLIADSRVNDKIFFSIPADTRPGIYEFMVVVPNSSGFTGRGFGDKLFSPWQYLEIIPPTTARFQIASEELFAKDETGNHNWTGSDEVGIKINAIPFYQNLTMGAVQQKSFRFSDVDTGERRGMEAVLFSHTKPIAGVILSILGHEIDQEEAYRDQITEWTDVFIELVKDQLAFLMAHSDEAKAAIKKLSELGFWGYVIIGVSIILTLGINLIYSLWASPELIIMDTLALSVTDLSKLTSTSFPRPVANQDTTLYETAEGNIRVRLMSNSKIPQQYTEERGYLSSDSSWYTIRLRYNQLA